MSRVIKRSGANFVLVVPYVRGHKKKGREWMVRSDYENVSHPSIIIREYSTVLYCNIYIIYRVTTVAWFSLGSSLLHPRMDFIQMEEKFLAPLLCRRTYGRKSFFSRNKYNVSSTTCVEDVHTEGLIPME